MIFGDVLYELHCSNSHDDWFFLASGGYDEMCEALKQVILLGTLTPKTLRIQSINRAGERAILHQVTFPIDLDSFLQESICVV